MSERQPAEGFPPAAYIEDMLADRGKDTAWLLQKAGQDSADVEAVMQGRHMTWGAAKALGRAFDTSPGLWANLNNAWWSWLEYTLRRESMRQSRHSRRGTG